MIAIIAAMDCEVEAIVSLLENKQSFEKSGIQFFQGELLHQKLLVMKSGVGKGNASMSTTILLENYSIDKIINIGTAGGLKKDQKILDAVVATSVVQYDYDTSPVDGEEGLGLTFSCDSSLMNQCLQALTKIKVVTHCGLIASGDQFVARPDQLKRIEVPFPLAICAEMEAGAIAQVANHYQIPFVVLRSLSDVAHQEDSHMDFLSYAKLAAKRSAEFVSAFLSLYL